MSKVSAERPLNARQHKALTGFLKHPEEPITVRRWREVFGGDCSADTALRDIADLVARGALRKNEGGSKNTNYSIDLGIAELEEAPTTRIHAAEPVIETALRPR